MVIGTDCIGSCKSNYHTIMATTAPQRYLYFNDNSIKNVHKLLFFCIVCLFGCFFGSPRSNISLRRNIIHVTKNWLPYWIFEIQNVNDYNIIQNKDIAYLLNNFLFDFIRNWSIHLAKYRPVLLSMMNIFKWHQDFL